MKHLLYILSLISLAANAQTVKSLYDDEYMAVAGAYYKDIHNDFNAVTGTWKYTNGNTSLTITLQKKEMVPGKIGSDEFFADMVIGGYKYIENGTEIINTLEQLSLDLPYIYSYHIVGKIIVGPGKSYCNNCGPNDRRILLFFSDPTCHILGYTPAMFFQRADSGNIQKLKLVFEPLGHMIVEEGVDPPCTEYKVPFGEYILVKQ